MRLKGGYILDISDKKQQTHTMVNIIIDTNVIILYPKILGLQIPYTNFIVPLDVISELNHRANQKGKTFDDRIDLIEKSAAQGAISIINTDLPEFKKFISAVNFNKISRVDYSIISIALNFQEKDQAAKIATFDKGIQIIAIKNNIEILSKEEIENLLLSFKKPTIKTSFTKTLFEIFKILFWLLNTKTLIGTELANKTIRTKNKITRFNPFSSTVQDDIIGYERKEKVNLIIGIIIGVASTLLALFVYKNLEKIIATINIWGTIISICISGLLLFVFREKQRLSYGVFEFLVGVLAIVLLFHSDNFDYSKIKFTLDFNVKLLGGLYIMVRGQDNIVKALKDTKLGVRLKNFGIGTETQYRNCPPLA